MLNDIQFLVEELFTEDLKEEAFCKFVFDNASEDGYIIVEMLDDNAIINNSGFTDGVPIKMIIDFYKKYNTPINAKIYHELYDEYADAWETNLSAYLYDY